MRRGNKPEAEDYIKVRLEFLHEEKIIEGILSNELEPMNDQDVDIICDLIDSLILELGVKK